MRLIGSLIRRLSPLLRSQAFRLQSQMDIHPRSLWFNRNFARATGGFYPPREKGVRSIKPGQPWDLVRRDMLVLLMRDIEVRGVRGSLAEVGVYRGGTARLIHHYLPHRLLHLCDTFEGFREADTDAEATVTGIEVESRQFADTSVNLVRDRIEPRNGNVVFHPGAFPESCKDSMRGEKFAFVHLDVDLYQPMLAALEFFYPSVVPGGYIVVHDYNAWHGARRATDEFLSEKPEIAVPMPDKSGSAVIVKAG